MLVILDSRYEKKSALPEELEDWLLMRGLPEAGIVGPIASWSDEKSKYVKSQEFWAACHPGNKVVFFNNGPTLFVSWNVKKIIESGNPLLFVDSDYEVKVIGSIRRQWKHASKMFYNLFGDYINDEKFYWALGENPYEVLVPSAEGMDRFYAPINIDARFDETPEQKTNGPASPLPRWMRSSRITATADPIIDDSVWSYVDKKDNVRVYKDPRVKDQVVYRQEPDDAQDIDSNFYDQEPMHMLEEYLELSELVSKDRPYGGFLDSFHGTWDQWVRLGVLEQYFGAVTGEEEQRYWENPNADDYEASADAYVSEK